MDFFYGVLVQNKELNRTARQQKSKYHEVTVSQAEQHSYLQQGWQLKRQLKSRTRLFKEKQPDELLEDKVWLLFYKMGFAEMNKDRNFKIQAGPIQKQIDVFAKDGNNAFIVECKASTEGTQVSRKDIHEISDLKRDITDSVRKNYDDRHIRVSFVLATQGMRWSEDNETLAKENGIFVWKEAELEYYSKLAEHLRNSAKFQLYSILFRDRKAHELRNITVPAIYGGKGKEKYWSFIIQPEKLLQIAYIHHRRGTREERLSSYQRMLEKTRLEKIDRFISKGGYFPNNVIINFTKKPRFDKKAEVGDIVYGILTFPPYYASAWVIDGQHRLYGYANNKKKLTDTVPVLAFDSLDVKDQANLFVEINREQKKVPANLLWDLYPVIYADSEEEEHQIKRAISLIARKLNSDSDSPLHAHIKILSVAPKRKEIPNLTMTTVCAAIKENRLIKKDQTLLYKDDYNSTVDFASERLKAYFDVVSKSFPEDWQKGEKGLLRSNIGIRILFIIFRQLMLYLKYAGQEGIYEKRDLSEFKSEVNKLLNPIIVKLRDMPDEERSRIRKQVGKGPLTENAKRMTWRVKEEFNGFGLQLLGDNWAPPRPKKLSDEAIKQLLGDTEIRLRAFIAKELGVLYGKPWWRQGIPQGVKNYANERIREKIEKEPRQKDALLLLPPEKKLDYIATPHLREIIVYNPNWEQRFKHIFTKYKDITSVRFKSFEELRDTYGHHREQQCTEVAKNLGYWGMKWIRECIGLEEMEESG